jgi:uncharacterized membrane protein
MAFCSKCGAQITDGAAFCASCGGAAQAEAQQGYQQAEAQQGYQQADAQQGYQQPGQNYQQQTYQAPGGVVYPNLAVDADANKVFGIVSYFGILVLISIFGAPKNSKYARFHANQGLVLFIFDIVLMIAVAIISAILTAIGFSLYQLLAVMAIISTIIWLAAWVFIVVLVIIGIVNAAKGEMKPLPVIGKITILK